MKEVLYTKLAVVHGDPASPCAVVLDARSADSSHRRALIPARGDGQVVAAVAWVRRPSVVWDAMPL